jgi:thymidine kinase
MQKISCIFIDEAQFLTQDQVWNLTEIVDRLGIPVMCYGLRTDFQGNLFSGSAALFALADHIIEHKCICNCGHKAIMNGRLNALGEVIRTGEQMLIGGNDLYQSFCRKDYKNLSQKKI